MADLRAKAALADQLALVRSRRGGETEHLFPNGRVLRVLHRPMGDGSWVMTVEDVSKRKRAETLAAHLARHDALTGLPNRAQFIEALSLAIDQVRESGRRIALASFDLDHLGEVNDAHGVEAGDAVLEGIAARARADGRVGELVARVGGDEFCVLKTMEAEEELEEFVPRLLRTITTPIMVGGKRVSASARMGIAIYPNDASDGSRLMANAELALARAREEAAGAVCMYDPDYDEVARHRRELVRDMIEGLERGEFHVAYQQQLSILDGEVIGHEALLRWRHPIRGAIGPDEFIPVAEQSGFIGRLGLWVLETACREAMEVDLPGRLAVNLSPFQLDEVDLAANIARILRTTGFSPSRLELEVTETAVVSNKARALRTLGALQDLGIGIALDDFGTGYSSIETLRALRWDKLKLDRSLLTEVEDCTQGRAIMRAVISLGQALGTTVLAEGVETEVQLRLLQEEGCDQVQGYLFGRPAPIHQVRPTADADLEEPAGHGAVKLRGRKDARDASAEKGRQQRSTKMPPTVLSNHAIVDSGPTDPMISVVRYCGVERSSIVAGIKNGLTVLKRLAFEIGFEPRRAVVIYKNAQPTTVTVEVGIPIPEGLAYRNTGEFKSGRTPGGPALRSPAVAPGPTAIAATDALRRTAKEEGLLHEPYWWQVFEDTGDLDWADEASDVNLPVSVPDAS